MRVFVKLGVGNRQAQWENAARMNGHWLALAHRHRYISSCRVFGTTWCCVCVYISTLYLCNSHFCAIALVTLLCVV